MNPDNSVKKEAPEILVVDDTPSGLQLLTKILTDQGYRVRPASNGGLALRSVEARLPDLILMDIKMPDMNGYEVCRRLKSDEHSCKVPVIFLSALGETIEKVEGFNAGGVDYITKPYAPEEVVARVKTHLRLQELTEDLEKEVLKRTGELLNANRQLQQEIVEREHTEKELRDSEIRYRSLFEDSPISLWEEDFSQVKAHFDTLRASGVTDFREYFREHPEAVARCVEIVRVLDVNKATIALFGVQKKSEFLDSLEIFFTDEALEVFREELITLAEGGLTFKSEAALKTATGEEKIVVLELSVAAGYEESLGKVLVSLLDITERKGAEKEIHKLTLSMEQSPALIIITDLEGSIEYVNRKFVEVTGYSFEEVRGKNPRILKSGEMSPEEYKKLWDTIKAGKEWRGEFHNRKKNGKLYWEAAVITPIRDEGGRISHYLGVKEDVTVLKQLQQQLQQSQKMDSIGRLAGGIAHDFNNLLTVINGHCELSLMKIKEDHPVYRDILSIQQAGKGAENLTRQLLAFSRKQVYTPKVLDINHVITGLEKMMRRLIGEDIYIEMILKNEVGRIKADPGQIEQVLINLILNARDAINERTEVATGKKITIETRPVMLNDSYAEEHIGSRPGSHVVISVSDTGIGMNEELQSKIFDPFFTTKEKGKGTGLGMSTVYGIVKQNKGSIFVYSELGIGTAIKVYWPSTSSEPQAAAVESMANVSRGGKEVILVVEDDWEVKNFASRSLDALGYTVYESTNGEEALKLLEEKKYAVDLLLTDVVMPKMGGKELSEKLRQTNSDIRILFTSGYTDNRIFHNGQLGDDVNFLQKPYSIQALAKKVREVLDK